MSDYKAVQLKRSSTSGVVPTAAQLAEGELAINLADKKLYSKDDTAVFQVLGGLDVEGLVNLLYPVGTIYTTVNNSFSPIVTFPGTTWEVFGVGKMLVGQDTTISAFNTLEETGGSKDAVVVQHNHTASTNGEHTHTITSWTGSADDYGQVGVYPGMNTNSQLFTVNNPGNAVLSTAGSHTHAINNTGVDGTDKNLPPYVVVRMWKRTA